MITFEGFCRMIRRTPWLAGREGLWRAAGPLYESALRLFFPNGICRRMNGEAVYIPVELRQYPEEYEPEFWKAAMGEVRPGDSVADVGTALGFYAFAFARRVKPGGRVVAFEPDPVIFKRLNKLARAYPRLDVERVNAAVGERAGTIPFASRGIMMASVSASGQLQVPMVTLDDFYGASPLDIVKIDVEGYEGKVLEGCERIMSGPHPPRAFFIEIHPYAWAGYATTGAAILSRLRDAGYRVTDAEGREVQSLSEYGSIVARKEP